MMELSRVAALLDAATPAEQALLAQACADACAAGAGALRDAALRGAARGEASTALFFALQEEGEARWRGVIDAALTQATATGDALRMATQLPFRMAWEMQCNRMAGLGAVAEVFRQEREHLAGGLGLMALADCIELCSEQIYEHWRAMVDIFRENVRAVVRTGGTDAADRCFAAAAMLKGVRLGLIDPERYGQLAAEMAESACDQVGTDAVSCAAWLRAQAELARGGRATQ